jgi:hypothetical protein
MDSGTLIASGFNLLGYTSPDPTKDVHILLHTAYYRTSSKRGTLAHVSHTSREKKRQCSAGCGHPQHIEKLQEGKAMYQDSLLPWQGTNLASGCWCKCSTSWYKLLLSMAIAECSRIYTLSVEVQKLETLSINMLGVPKDFSVSLWILVW